MNFEETPEFQKDLKRLNKKPRSLAADLQSFRNIAAATRADAAFAEGRLASAAAHSLHFAASAERQVSLRQIDLFRLFLG